MTKHDEVLQKKKSIAFAIAASITLLAICLSFIVTLYSSFKHREKMEATERYMTFESKVERLIYSNITLLQGFEAYTRVNPNFGEDIYLYLEYLLADHLEIIRNIGIIEDTTILWNYPREGNALAIGVDLAMVDTQKEQVLKVKAECKPLLQGPINLVQGGSGFSVRIPIMRERGVYWGQASIVLKTDILLKEIRNYAQSASLDIVICNQQEPDTPFFGEFDSRNYSALRFQMDPAFINWTVYVYMQDNLSGVHILLLSVMISLLFAAAIGIFMYKYLKNNYKILNMSAHDFLTGLYNRHFLNEYQQIVLDVAKRACQRAGMLMIDLNRFKAVNDTYGHDVGDKVLVEAARILRKLSRSGETVFRLGGDEFLIVLPQVEGEQDLLALVKRLNQEFEEEFKIPGYSIKIDFSIGYAIFPEDGKSFNALLRAADRRLYENKGREI